MAGCYSCLVAVAFLAMVIASGTDAVIQCNDAVSQVIPCEAFLVRGDSVPSTACCSAVQSLDGIARNPADRKAICECFKQTASSFPVNLSKAQQLPQLCHVSLPVAIDPNVDCSRM